MGMVSGDIVETKRQVKAENRVAEDKDVVVNYTNRREKDDRVMKNHFREIDEPLLSSCQPADPVGISLKMKTVSLTCLTSPLHLYQENYFTLSSLLRMKMETRRVQKGRRWEREISSQFQAQLKHL